MAICRLPRIGRNSTHICICPGICEMMSLTRFEEIYRFFHLCDSENEVAAGMHMFKVGFVISSFSFPVSYS